MRRYILPALLVLGALVAIAQGLPVVYNELRAMPRSLSTVEG
jgi:hypothetical protein